MRSDLWIVQKRRLALIVLLLVSLFGVLPLPAGAATSVADYVTTPASEHITRGAFIKAAVQALGLAGNAKTDQAIFDVAKKEGALTQFGSSLSPGKKITRGEAMQVLYGLTDLSSNLTVKFSDVKAGSQMERAVKVAVENKWIRPLRPRVFGVTRPVTGRDARLILARAMRTSAPAADDGTVNQIIRVKVTKTRQTRALPKSDVLQTVWDLLNEQYLYQDRINPGEAAYKSIEGLVQSLGDPYTVFMRPTSSQNFRNQIQGEITGIGAQVEQRDGVIIVVSPLKGSPAEKAGVKPGDEILKVDDVPLAGMGFEDAVNKIRGPKGSTVKLHIRRDGIEFDFSVIRDVVRIAEIEISNQENVAVVKIHQFGRLTETELRSHMADIQSKNPKGIIIDLRNNPGGLLHAADIVVSNFLPTGSAVAHIEASNQTVVEETQDPPTINATTPVVVLVNKGSASASEIVAGALQDAKRATVVGVTTFGKGTVQQVIQFTDGSALKMTVAEWKTPSGRKIDGVGVVPDVVVEEEQGGRDLPMLKALEILR